MPRWSLFKRHTDAESEELERLRAIHARLIEEDRQQDIRGGDDVEELNFLRSLERRAQRLGTRTDVLLDDYGRRIRESKYPTPYCLKPDELLAFAGERELSSDAKEHVKNCGDCRSLLNSAHISEQRVHELLARVSVASNEQARRQDAVPATVTTRAVDSRFLLARSMPKWLPAAAVLLLTFGLAYPKVEPYFARSGSYVVAKFRQAARWYEKSQREDQEQKDRAREQLVAEFGLKQLAGDLPENPREMQRPVEAIKRASSEGVLMRSESIVAGRRNLERKAVAAKSKDRNRWLKYNLELAGAETLTRYEELRADGVSTSPSLQDLKVTDVSIRNETLSVTVESNEIFDLDTRSLLQQSFAQTQGVSRLDIYRGKRFAYQLTRPN